MLFLAILCKCSNPLASHNTERFIAYAQFLSVIPMLVTDTGGVSRLGLRLTRFCAYGSHSTSRHSLIPSRHLYGRQVGMAAMYAYQAYGDDTKLDIAKRMWGIVAQSVQASVQNLPPSTCFDNIGKYFPQGLFGILCTRLIYMTSKDYSFTEGIIAPVNVFRTESSSSALKIFSPRS